MAQIHTTLAENKFYSAFMNSFYAGGWGGGGGQKKTKGKKIFIF